MKNPKIGFLPLYLELYDKSLPELRVRIDAFRETMVEELEKRGLELVPAPACKIREEFAKAIKTFEEQKVDAIITLHLAYSPSLESSDILAATKLPIIILDTTPTYDFSPDQNAEEILYNHGIHGVQDMCNLLKRNKKDYFLEAGHWQNSDVLDRVVGCARSIKIANSLKNARVGRVGEPFSGMGDFDVSADTLRTTIGVETILFDFKEGLKLIQEVKSTDVAKEVQYNLTNYQVDGGISTDIHNKSEVVNLAIRRWVKNEKLTAFTVNFLATQDQPGLPVMPFLEASKAMGRGIGYAGEGDVLTAALVGALLSVYSETTFTEMFCPDWKNNSIFLSHMGEFNINLTADKPKLVEKDFPYTNADNPVVAYGRLKEGKAVLVNLAPGAEDTYTLIVADIDMLGVTGKDKMEDSVHGWFRPQLPITSFLKEYSLAGGTHHCALVYGNVAEEIMNFGKIMGWNVVEIG